MVGSSAITGCRRWASKAPRGRPSFALWFRVVAYGGLMMLARYRRPYGLWSDRRFNAPLMRRLLRYGGPNGLQLLVEIAGFTLFLLLVGNLGENAMAATTLAFNVNTLAFVPMLGLGVGLSTMVGQQLGRNHPGLAARATWTSLWMAMVYMGAMALVYVLLPDLLLMGHAIRHVVRRVYPASRHYRGSAPLRGRLLPLRRHERGLLRGAERRGRHAVHPDDFVGDDAYAAAGGLGGHALLRRRAALVLGGRYSVDLRVGPDLRRPFSARPLAADASDRIGTARRGNIMLLGGGS